MTARLKAPGYKPYIKIDTSRNSYVKLTMDRILVTEMNKTAWPKANQRDKRSKRKHQSKRLNYKMLNMAHHRKCKIIHETSLNTTQVKRPT